MYVLPMDDWCNIWNTSDDQHRNLVPLPLLLQSILVSGKLHFVVYWWTTHLLSFMCNHSVSNFATTSRAPICHFVSLIRISTLQLHVNISFENSSFSFAIDIWYFVPIFYNLEYLCNGIGSKNANWDMWILLPILSELV